MSGLTNARFAQTAAYLAKNAAHWAGDCLALQERWAEPIPAGVAARFTDEIRQVLDTIDHDAGVPKPEADDSSFMPGDGAIYRHNKTGRYYRVLMCARLEATEQHLTIYQHIDGTMPWVRPTAEFGQRFSYVPNGEIPDVDLRAAGIKR